MDPPSIPRRQALSCLGWRAKTMRSAARTTVLLTHAVCSECLRIFAHGSRALGEQTVLAQSHLICASIAAIRAF